MENTKFSSLGLKKEILKAIDDMGFEEPSKIQSEIIPVLLEGHDAIGQAQTGTGKTLAFGAPILNNIEKESGKIVSIILVPTRELAIQVNDELKRIAKYLKIRILPVYGGQPIERQISALKKGIDIIVGTPGRVLDLIGKKIIDLSSVKYLVLDEADEMLNMGFIEDIEEIIGNCGNDRQTMLFSATMPQQIQNLAKQYMKKEAKFISILKNTMTVATVHQYYYEIKQKDRFESLCRILDMDEPSSTIIFCKTRKGVDELVEGMQARGYNVEGMHGDINQNQRINTLRKFKEGSIEFLVATDVAARGIDVENVSHVINYDLPQDIESYVHRIGRTGRANKEGTAYTLVTAREYMMLKQIERETKAKIRRKEIPSIDDIFLARYKSMLSRIRENIQNEDYQKFVPLAAELDEEFNLVDVAAALMNMLYNKEISYEYTDDSIISAEESKDIRIFMSAGRIDKVTPKLLLQFLNQTAGINREEVGDIAILEKFTFFNVTEEAANLILKKCHGKKIGERKVRVDIAENRPGRR